MATTFPTTIDAFTNTTTPTTTTLGTVVWGRTHSGFHNDYNDAIEAIEAKVGVDGSAVTASLTYKVTTLETNQTTLDAQNVKLTGTQTITGNKTFSGTTTFSGTVVGIPWITGEIKIWTTGTAPTNWLLCDGTAVSRTTYATLFGVIGVVYGVGNGTTTFNVPNLRGRVVVGFDVSQVEFDVLGETGGAKTHTLTAAEIPSHTHNFSLNTTSGGTGKGYAGLDATAASTTTDGGTGGGTTHNNLQPYMALNYIIAT